MPILWSQQNFSGRFKYPEEIRVGAYVSIHVKGRASIKSRLGAWFEWLVDPTFTPFGKAAGHSLSKWRKKKVKIHFFSRSDAFFLNEKPKKRQQDRRKYYFHPVKGAQQRLELGKKKPWALSQPSGWSIWDWKTKVEFSEDFTRLDIMRFLLDTHEKIPSKIFHLFFLGFILLSMNILLSLSVVRDYFMRLLVYIVLNISSGRSQKWLHSA